MTMENEPKDESNLVDVLAKIRKLAEIEEQKKQLAKQYADEQAKIAKDRETYIKQIDAQLAEIDEKIKPFISARMELIKQRNLLTGNTGKTTRKARTSTGKYLLDGVEKSASGIISEFGIRFPDVIDEETGEPHPPSLNMRLILQRILNGTDNLMYNGAEVASKEVCDEIRSRVTYEE